MRRTARPPLLLPLLVALVGLAALVACGGDPIAEPPPAAPRVASLRFQGVPAPPLDYFVLRAGASLQLSLAAHDSAGNAIARPAVVWRTYPHPSYPERGEALVDSTGRVTGVRAGWVEVTAYAGGIGAIAAVYVRNPVAAISLGADSLRIVVGVQRRLELTLRDSAGRVIPVPVRVELSTTAPAVAAVDSAGVVRTLAEGRATVAAAVDGVVARVAVAVSAVRFTQVATGAGFSCGVESAGEVLCWGENGMSQLGNVTPSRCAGVAGQRCGQQPSAIPLYVSGGGRFAQVSAGKTHACALTTSGAAYCWGRNGTGELGTSQALRDCFDLIGGDVGPCTATPVAVEGGRPFAALSAGVDETCALDSDGRAWCWGGIRWAYDGTRYVEVRGSRVPAAVPGGRAFRSVSTGQSHVCALTAAGEAYCWGTNLRGELGVGASDPAYHATPERVAGALTFVAVGAGGNASCGLTGAGRVHCWGAEYGLGRAAAPERCSLPATPGSAAEDTPCSARPVPIESDRTFGALAVAFGAACALDSEGTPWCWDVNHRVPVPVTGAPPLRTLSAGYYSSGCGLSRDDGAAYCWTSEHVAQRVPGQR
jgi:hypothetical protein